MASTHKTAYPCVEIQIANHTLNCVFFLSGGTDVSGFKIEQVRDMLLKALRDGFLIKSCLQPKVLKGHVGNLRLEMLSAI